MIKIIKIEEDLNYRLDKFLKLKFTSLTQSFVEKNIRKKNILINNSRTQAKYNIKKNDELKILNYHKDLYKNKIIIKKNLKIPNKFIENFKKAILFENKDFIVIDKWGSIATQGGSKINISIDDIIKNICLDYKLVHRLDKETSGLLLIAKNLNSARMFGNLFKLKLIEKTYLALCEGSPKENESLVKLNIKSKNTNKDQTETYYKVLYKYKNNSVILFKPRTGKTHQIRIVSKNLGCPIIGDDKYNAQSKFKTENLKLNAHSLKFKYNMQSFEFQSKLPKDFDIYLKRIKIKNIFELKTFKA